MTKKRITRFFFNGPRREKGPKGQKRAPERLKKGQNRSEMAKRGQKLTLSKKVQKTAQMRQNWSKRPKMA